MGAESIHKNIDIYRFKETKDSFSGVCTIVYDSNSAFIKGLHGTIDFKDRTLLKSYLTKKGIKNIFFVRHKKSTKRLVKKEIK